VRSRLLLLVLAAFAVRADVRDCVCDLANPATAQIRACSLCLEAEKVPANQPFFLLKDNDPTKPNRWLALPRHHFDGANPLARMTASERVAMWTLAIQKGRELWGDGWAVALNGDLARLQCHEHVHIGKLLDGNETAIDAIYVDGPAGLPAIADGAGLWFHPVGSRLHVHTGQQVNETVLMR
jgi:hypothetical protein